MDAKDEKSNGTGIDNGLGKLVVVLGNAGKSESGSFLDRWVELFKAVDESVESSRVDYSFSEMW